MEGRAPHPLPRRAMVVEALPHTPSGILPEPRMRLSPLRNKKSFSAIPDLFGSNPRLGSL